LQSLQRPNLSRRQSSIGADASHCCGAHVRKASCRTALVPSLSETALFIQMPPDTSSLTASPVGIWIAVVNRDVLSKPDLPAQQHQPTIFVDDYSDNALRRRGEETAGI
jgi:hypothetical protein